MSILENLYWGGNGAHVHDFFGQWWPLVSCNLIFFMALLLTINLAVAKRFWLIPSRFRWVHGCILVLHGSWLILQGQ